MARAASHVREGARPLGIRKACDRVSSETEDADASSVAGVAAAEADAAGMARGPLRGVRALRRLSVSSAAATTSAPPIIHPTRRPMDDKA